MTGQKSPKASQYPARSTAAPAKGSDYDSRADDDNDRIAEDALADGGEVVGGALILRGKRLGEYQLGKFKPSLEGTAWASAREGEVEEVVDSPISSSYDPAEHTPVEPIAKAAVEKVNATNAAIAEANALTEEERAAIEDATAASSTTARAGKKKVGATDSTASTSTAPTSS